MSKLILGGVGVLVLVGIAFGSSNDGGGGDPGGGSDRENKPSQSETVGDDIGAQAICRQFVEQRLKSPSSADFSGEAVRQVNGPVWVVAGDVDSENSFGAMIRNQYVCKVRFVSDDQWRLINLSGLAN